MAYVEEAWRSVVPGDSTHFPSRRRGGTLNLRRIEQLDRRTRHDGADGMLVHELGMPIPAQQNGKIVKPGNDALELDTVHKEHRYRRFAFPHVVQEDVLNILRFLVGHGQTFLFMG
jgi:hypothetical protein